MATGKRGGRGVRDRNIGESAGIRPYKLDLVYATEALYLAAKSARGENSSSAEEGDFFYDSTTNSLKVHNGTEWQEYISESSITGDVTIDQDGAATVTDLTMTGEASNEILYFDGSNWASIAVSGAVTHAAGVFTLGGNLATGFINLDLHSLREIATNDYQALAAHGGVLATDSVPDLYRINGATDRAAKVEWKTGEADEVQFPPIALPPDYDNSADTLAVHCIWSKDGNTDTAAVVDVQAFSGIGDTEMGGNTAAINVAADTAFETSVTLTGANVGAHPGFLNICLVPGTHANDVLRLHAAWIEYPRTP